MRSKNLRTTSQVRRDYDQSVLKYDKIRYGTSGGLYVDMKEQEFVASMIKGSAVLEMGTATGRFAESLIERGAEYTGIDLSQRMLRATYDRTNRSASVIQMDGSHLGLRPYFDQVLCIRTFHFLPRPDDALRGMLNCLKVGGMALVTFETDNFLRRLLLLFGIGTSEQYYYKRSDVEEMFQLAGFNVTQSGPLMRIPVTLYRRCPPSFLPILKKLEKLWPWPMHDYVLGAKSPTLGIDVS